MTTTIAQFRLATTSDIRASAQRARLLATLVDLPSAVRTQFGQAVRDVGQQCIAAGERGTIDFVLDADTDQLVVIGAVIHVPEVTGWPDRESADSPETTPREAAVSIRWQPPTIRITTQVASEYAEYGESELAEWEGVLKTRRIQSALTSTHRRTRELAEELAAAQRQRQDLEAELQQSRSINETLTLLSLVASKTDNAVVILDEEGRIVWLNDSFIRITGYSMQDASGRSPDELLAGVQSSAEALAEIRRSLNGGHGVTEEFLQYRLDGSTSWIQLSLTPVHDDDGTVRRWIGIGADITRRREVQQALEDARDAAENASRLKGEFLANISHEIRTPMNAIIGMTDLALGTTLDDEQTEYLTTVRHSAGALLELLNDILDLSRIESGRMELETDATQIARLLDDALKPLKIIADQKQIDLVWSVAEDTPSWVMTDALRLRQILINLAGNAVKFTNAGGVSIDVDVTQDENELRWLRFRVTDTGIGIAPEKQQRIFDAFTQADASVTRQFGGTGLGLAITAQLVQLMDGQLTVDSRQGYGSTFSVAIPMNLPQADQVPVGPVTAVSVPSPSVSGQLVQPLHVLVADDHEANRQLIAAILSRRGHTSVFAENGRRAIECFQQSEFDVVLMDVQMPETDGYQATRAIRDLERPAQTHVPIIAVTAHAMQGEREACLSAGMDAWLPKPVSAGELLTLIESLSGNQVNLSPVAVSATGIVAADAALSEATPPTEADSVGLAGGGRSFDGALARLDHDPELLHEQMTYFLRDGPELLEMLDKAVQQGDDQQRRIAAHRLKNLCATFDDDSAAALSAQIETFAGNTSGEVLMNLTRQLTANVRQLLAEIEEFTRMRES